MCKTDVLQLPFVPEIALTPGSRFSVRFLSFLYAVILICFTICGRGFLLFNMGSSLMGQLSHIKVLAKVSLVRFLVFLRLVEWVAGGSFGVGGGEGGGALGGAGATYFWGVWDFRGWFLGGARGKKHS
jgi:hypothetical protein